MKDPNYWVVGAMFGGSEDHLPNFVKRSYWYCWDPKINPTIPKVVQEKFPLIQEGDRIAVKKLLGKGATEIQIRALGIVRDVDLNEWRIYVDWILPKVSRKVPIKGCVGSIHGPFSNNDEWVRKVFCI